MTETTSEQSWRDEWKKQDAWTAAEFAMLCCGWNPGLREHPDQEQYNNALEMISRAVRVNILPVFELRWAGTVADQLYASVPLFEPKAVAKWATKHFSQFPFGPDDFDVVGDALDTRERTTLLITIAALATLAELDISQHSKAAEVIASKSEQMGAPIAKRTVEKHLSRVADAIERKS